MSGTKVAQKFKPTEDQLKVLEASMNMEIKPTISAFMDEAGVSRRNWYNWIGNPEFVKWWGQQWEMFMGANVFHLDKMCYMKAASDFRYMELLQMKFAKFRRQQDVTSNNEKIEGIIVDFGENNVSQNGGDQCSQEDNISPEDI